MEIPKQFWGKVYFNHQDDVDDNKVIKKNHQFNHVLKLEMYKRQSALESWRLCESVMIQPKKTRHWHTIYPTPKPKPKQQIQLWRIV